MSAYGREICYSEVRSKCEVTAGLRELTPSRIKKKRQHSKKVYKKVQESDAETVFSH